MSVLVRPDGEYLSAVKKEPTVQELAKLYEPLEFESSFGVILKFRYLRPESCHKGQVPLVIFLHGAGERGNDNLSQLTHGLADFCKPERRQRYPYILIAPQCPNNRRWVDVDWSSTSSSLPGDSFCM